MALRDGRGDRGGMPPRRWEPDGSRAPLRFGRVCAPVHESLMRGFTLVRGPGPGERASPRATRTVRWPPPSTSPSRRSRPPLAHPREARGPLPRGAQGEVDMPTGQIAAPQGAFAVTIPGVAVNSRQKAFHVEKVRNRHALHRHGLKLQRHPGGNRDQLQQPGCRTSSRCSTSRTAARPASARSDGTYWFGNGGPR